MRFGSRSRPTGLRAPRPQMHWPPNSAQTSDRRSTEMPAGHSTAPPRRHCRRRTRLRVPFRAGPVRIGSDATPTHRSGLGRRSRARRSGRDPWAPVIASLARPPVAHFLPPCFLCHSSGPMQPGWERVEKPVRTGADNCIADAQIARMTDAQVAKPAVEYLAGLRLRPWPRSSRSTRGH